MTRTTSKQQIIDQDNARLLALVDAYNTAYEYWHVAYTAYDQDDSTSRLEKASEADKAGRAYRDAIQQLARFTASAVRAGYRLDLPKGSNDAT